MNIVQTDDLKILTRLNLIELTRKIGFDSWKEDILVKKFEELVWGIFFETDINELKKEEKNDFEKLLERKDKDSIERFLRERFDNIQERMLKNSLLAKKKMIIDLLDIVMEIEKDSGERYRELKSFAQEDQWKEFANLLKK